MKKIQKDIDDIFKKNFGYTPLGERLKDIQSEFFELMKWQSVANLKEELGDLICSCIELATESGWDVEELVRDTLKKIESRHLQYKSLGRKYKIAIFGGAFDPITNGHIGVAKFVLNTSGEFDEVWLLPAYKHMYNKKMSSAKHRIAMCKLAAESDKRIKVWDYEISNELSGETFNLFKRIKSEPSLTENYNFSMIIGLDNALTFDKWVNYQELERMVRFIVIDREGYKSDPKINWFLKPPHIYLNQENHIPEVSSTQIRNEIREHSKFWSLREEIIKNLDPKVIEYISKHKLYQK